MDELVHEYDAAKRREYYLRTRKLKGRKPGATKVTATRKPAASKPPVKTMAQRRAERRKHLEAQVEALKSRLEKLREVLKLETAKAQARSGVKPASTAKKTTQQKSNSTTKKLTPQEKAKKAAADKKYREKNQDQLLADQVKSLTEKIKTMKERIEKMRKNGSVGAKKTTTK